MLRLIYFTRLIMHRLHTPQRNLSKDLELGRSCNIFKIISLVQFGGFLTPVVSRLTVLATGLQEVCSAISLMLSARRPLEEGNELTCPSLMNLQPVMYSNNEDMLSDLLHHVALITSASVHLERKKKLDFI